MDNSGGKAGRIHTPGNEEQRILQDSTASRPDPCGWTREAGPFGSESEKRSNVSHAMRMYGMYSKAACYQIE